MDFLQHTKVKIRSFCVLYLLQTRPKSLVSSKEANDAKRRAKYLFQSQKFSEKNGSAQLYVHENIKVYRNFQKINKYCSLLSIILKIDTIWYRETLSIHWIQKEDPDLENQLKSNH